MCSYHFPLIEIQLEQRLDGLCEQMKAVDICAVSQHAVAAVDNYLEQKKNDGQPKFTAIGHKPHTY